MSHNKKISVMILSDEGSWAEGLITTILGKNFFKIHKKKTQKNTEIYKNEIFDLNFIPQKPWDDIKDLCSEHTDMCLLVVDATSLNEVWQQIEDLSKKTGIPTEKFIVVLPLGYKPGDHPFNYYTIKQLFNELEKLAKEKQLVPINTTHEPSTASPPAGGSFNKEPSTDTTNSLKSENLKMSELEKGNQKGKHTRIKVNLVLLGMSGTGKSVSGNNILRKNVFMSKPSSSSITTECQVEETEINGTHVRVIDTPDIFDDDIKPSVRDKHVKRCRELCESGPSVFVLVMHVSRFTDGERDVLRKLEKAFGSKVREQTLILFTRGDDLQQADMSLEDFLHSCQPDLKEIIQKCGNRCVLFENGRESSDQVEKLMDAVMGMIQEQQK